MLAIYGDESSDSKGNRVYAVAGLLGGEESWEGLREDWAARTGDKVFHSADCESGYGDFKDTPPEERDRLHKDLAVVLAGSGLIGWGIAVDLAGARKAFPDMLPEHVPNSCFLRAVDFHMRKALADYPPQPIRIVFDQNRKTEHNSRLLFEYLADEAGKVRSQLPNTPEFVSRQDIGVQAADLWVRELMKFFDGTLFSHTYRPREQWRSLVNSRRFGGDLQFGDYFESMKDQMAALEAKTGMSHATYAKWLVEKRRIDNQSNRIAYMMEVAAKDRASGRGTAGGDNSTSHTVDH